jgi:hypothetical protein
VLLQERVVCPLLFNVVVNFLDLLNLLTVVNGVEVEDRLLSRTQCVLEGSEQRRKFSKLKGGEKA